MKVLLISPAYPETFWSYKYALKFIRKRAAYPPLGLLTVAAMLPPEWEKRVVDVNVRPLSEADLAWADLAFISGMLVQRESARAIIGRCKDAGLTVVAGGPLFGAEHEAFDLVDHFVLNEAELTLPPFLSDLARGEAGRIYRTEGFCDIRETPAPLWELIDLRRYASMSIQFSRGCPFTCDFCNVTALFGHKPRTKTADQILGELDRLYGLGWRGPVFFVDDNFIGNKKYLKSTLLPALIRWQKNGRGLPFFTEASINLADDPELMEMMVEAGFDMVFMGLETPNEDSLAECNKIQNRNRNLIEDVKTIHRTGLQVSAGFIVGFDSDTRSIFERQIDFIQRSGIVTAMVGLLQAIPGTRLYERLKGESRLMEVLSGNTDGTTNIIPRMGLEELRDGYKRIMAHIYAPRHYYQRVKTFLRDYTRPKFGISLDFQRVLAFFRCCIRLGIFGRERVEFWKLCFWTLTHRPELFPTAITLAIYGHHFRRVAEFYLR